MRVVLDTNTLVSGVISPSGPLDGELRRLVTMAAPRIVPRVIEHDADDDHVLACGIAEFLQNCKP